MGSCGSQTTFNSGRAVIAAAGDVRDQLLDAAAEQLEAAREDLELADGLGPRQGLAGQVGRRSPISPASGTFHGKGSGELPEAPPATPPRAASAGSGSSRSSRRS